MLLLPCLLLRGPGCTWKARVGKGSWDWVLGARALTRDAMGKVGLLGTGLALGLRRRLGLGQGRGLEQCTGQPQQGTRWEVALGRAQHGG